MNLRKRGRECAAPGASEPSVDLGARARPSQYHLQKSGNVTFGRKDEVDPVRHPIGTASAGGLNLDKEAVYVNVAPARNDATTNYKLNVCSRLKRCRIPSLRENVKLVRVFEAKRFRLLVIGEQLGIAGP